MQLINSTVKRELSTINFHYIWGAYIRVLITEGLILEGLQPDAYVRGTYIPGTYIRELISGDLYPGLITEAYIPGGL